MRHHSQQSASSTSTRRTHSCSCTTASNHAMLIMLDNLPYGIPSEETHDKCSIIGAPFPPVCFIKRNPAKPPTVPLFISPIRVDDAGLASGCWLLRRHRIREIVVTAAAAARTQPIERMSFMRLAEAPPLWCG